MSNPIKDSGSRTHYGTGAVRDLRTGKGRMDLMPLDIASELYNFAPNKPYITEQEIATQDMTLFYMDDFVYHGNCTSLVKAMYEVIVHNDVFLEEHKKVATELGCHIDIDKVTAKEVVSTALLVLSVHFENGTIKYGERNWEKGIPTHAYIDSAARHYVKMTAGFMDEPHHLATLWNLMCAVWTCRNKSDMNDLPFAKK